MDFLTRNGYYEFLFIFVGLTNSQMTFKCLINIFFLVIRTIHKDIWIQVNLCTSFRTKTNGRVEGTVQTFEDILWLE